MTVDAAIQVRGLARSFGATKAVQSVDLEVQSGTIFGLLGPDGAGKTTTIRMLVGATPIDAGEGHVLGVELRNLRRDGHHNVGYVSQRFSLYGDLTVAENLAYTAEIYQVPRTEIASREREMLAFSRMEPFRNRLAHDLSGGMKQKLALACTLIHRPALLFLDEPTTGVDPVSRRDFWKILYRLVADGMTILVSTPYMDEAERCSRVAIMDRGRILRIDTPARLKTSLTGALYSVDVERERQGRDTLRALPNVVDVQVFGDRLHVLTAPGDDPSKTISDALAGAQNPARSIEPITPGLEDVFVTMIAESRKHGGDAIA